MDPIRTAPETIHAAIEEHFPQHLAAVQELVRVPSISNEGVGMQETAARIGDLIREAGGTAELFSTPGYPVVYGEINAGKPRTVLFYGMYDVQPVAGEEWIVPPFAGEVVDLDPFGPCLVARGVFNSKGPLQGTLNVISLLNRLDQLPVNVKFMIEGEEEMGSKHLPDFVQAHREMLRADAAFFPFYSQNRAGTPILYLGCKGFLYLELVTRGGPRGGPRTRDVHSSFAAWVSSPAWRLVHALATLVDENETILVDGFFDQVSGPDADDEELLANLAERFDPQVWLAEADTIRFKCSTDDPKRLLRQYLFSPTVTIDGLQSGYQGPGMKTVLPHTARAKVDVRLVPNMRAADILNRLRQHLAARGFSDVKVELLGCYGPAKISVRDAAAQALIETYKRHGYDPEIWPTLGGSAPFYLFTEELGIPVLMGGLGHGGRAHSPNEYATVEGMRLFEHSVATFLLLFGSNWRLPPETFGKTGEHFSQ